ncbi:sensor histidine kinase [Allokutzneria oryzae]|uniref:histidine kinase n=1 Tax=Allokutzneria oryzae TaxID=1378989 RepID=A0ABV6A0U8_9PSEU
MSTPPDLSSLKTLVSPHFLFTSRPWRALAHVVTTPAVSCVALAALALPGLPLLTAVSGKGETWWSAVLLAALGVVLVAVLGPVLVAPVAACERHRLKLIDRMPAERIWRETSGSGLRAWLQTRYTRTSSWCELAYSLLLAVVAPMLYGALALLLMVLATAVASPFLLGDNGLALAFGHIELRSTRDAVPWAIGALVLILALPAVWTLLAEAHGRVARCLLRRTAEAGLRTELEEVSRSRARLVNAFESERRRIERDLHDGAQQRLVSLTLQLGLARVDLPPDSPATQSVGAAHDQAKQLMTELRELINGIHPQVLTDRGLVAALHELAGCSPLRVEVDADVPTRPAPHVEATAYFVVAEALANVAKHSGAPAAAVVVRGRGGTLEMTITDNGRGGADPLRGTGLTGLADRVAVVGGTLALTSPVGGPTTVTVELPCT